MHERFCRWAVFFISVDVLLMAAVSLYPTIRDNNTGPVPFLSLVAVLAAAASYILRPWRT